MLLLLGNLDSLIIFFVFGFGVKVWGFLVLLIVLLSLSFVLDFLLDELDLSLFLCDLIDDSVLPICWIKFDSFKDSPDLFFKSLTFKSLS